MSCMTLDKTSGVLCVQGCIHKSDGGRGGANLGFFEENQKRLHDFGQNFWVLCVQGCIQKSGGQHWDWGGEDKSDRMGEGKQISTHELHDWTKLLGYPV